MSEKELTLKDLGLVEVPEIKAPPGDIVIALSGQQNTGKTTLFNALTGMHQHTGNWPGLTVDTASGRMTYKGQGYTIVDLPGTYSLLTASHEETIAASFVVSGKAACTVVVCDSTQLERNLVLPLQIMELTDNVILCVNLLDEAKKRGITVDFEELEDELHIPVVGIAAGPGWGLNELKEKIAGVVSGEIESHPHRKICRDRDNGLERVACLRGHDEEDADEKAEKIVHMAERIFSVSVYKTGETPTERRQRKLDNLIMGRGGILFALLLLFGVFWLTIEGANYPSEWLATLFDWVGGLLWKLAAVCHCPDWLSGILLDGIYGVSTTVISVMLPPMAIFFPCFTLLEDFGYLPRVAFRLDRSFESCGACGKQSLTMCMGFG
ncbi:MAG: 50S ribosome-binding GTPase, partial [Bacteroidales bacterium]|nr:50S ribosome-binding GTPase [Bacteroidales bacterium]